MIPRPRLNCLFLAALLLAPTLSAQPAPSPDYAALQTIFLDDSLGQLDFDAHAAKLLPIIEKSPASEEALAALRMLRALDEKLSSHTPILAVLGRLESDNFKACGVFAGYYADEYVRLALREDASSKPRDVERRWRGVTSFSVMGPFAEFGSAAHDDCFAPESRCDFAAEHSGLYGALRWKPLPHFDQTDDHLNLDLHARHAGSCYYAATILRSEKSGEATLRIDVDCPAKVWLRGAPLIDIDTRRFDFPQIFMNARLDQGDNLLLVKLSERSRLRVRICAKSGQQIPGLTATAPVQGVYNIDAGAALVEVPSVREAARFSREILRLKLEVLEALEFRASRGEDVSKERAEVARQLGLCNLALAQCYREHDLDTDATQAMEDAYALLQSVPAARLAFLEHIGESSLYSASEINGLRRSELGALLKEEKPLPAAQLEYAKLLARDERISEAFALFDQATSQNPKAWTVLLEQAQFCQQLQWRTEWLSSLERARKIAPRAPAVFKAFARYFESSETFGAVLAETLKLAEIWPGDPNLKLTLISQFQRAARPEQALAVALDAVQSRPGDSYALRRLAEVYGALGRVDDAVNHYELLASRSARPEEHLRTAAELLLSEGRNEQGQALLKRVLELAPDQHEVRRWLERLNGQSDRFWEGRAMTVEQIRKHDVQPASFPQCASVLLLDEQVQVVYPDGGSQLYVHQIRKILTQDGVDEFGRAQPNGEICCARTIKVNGTILEPVTFRGNQVEFPGVEVGAWLEIAYLQREESNPWRGVNPGRFYFADQTLVEPFVISRFVLVTPKDMAPWVRYHNWPSAGPELIQSEVQEGDLTLRTWDVRRPTYLEREPFMRSGLELIPWLEISRRRDWRERARELAEEGLPLLRTTKQVTAFARNLTRECKSDYAKARAIYEWVNTNLTTEGDSRNAHQALKARAGDRKRLFASMCHAVGVRLAFAYADAAPVYRGGQVEALPVCDWVGPDEHDFKTFLFVMRGEDGSRVFVNMDQRFRPFGATSARLDHAPAILWEAGRYELIEIPGGEKTRDRFHNRLSVTLKADGSAAASGAIETIGERSYELKDLLRKQTTEVRTRELEEQIADQLRGFDAEECSFPELDRIGTPLVREFKGNAPRLAKVAGARLSLALPLEKLAPLLSALVSKDQRRQDLVLDFDLNQTDALRIRPPEGYNFAALPDDVLLPCAPLTYSLAFRLEKGELVVTRRLVLGPGRVPTHAYADFVRQVRRIGQVEDVQLTLVKDGTKAAGKDDIAPKGGKKSGEKEEEDF